MTDAFRLDGRVAVVTEAANGIGHGIADVLAESGATVIVADRDAAATAGAVADLYAAGHAAGAVRLNLAGEAVVVRACADVASRAGAPWLPVDNAALQGHAMPFDATVKERGRMHAVNTWMPFPITHEPGWATAAGRAGERIVENAFNGVLTPMAGGLSACVVSKSGSTEPGLQSTFERVGHGITVNTVLPGRVVQAGARSARADARRPSVLASPAARHVRTARHRRSGAVLHHPGGTLRHQSGDRTGCRLLACVTRRPA